MSEHSSIRRELCDIGRRVYERGLVSGTDGNLSARLADGTYLVSRSGVCLGVLAEDDFVVIDAAGRAIDGTSRPSSERWMHLAAYAERPDIHAAIHAHPPTVVAFTVASDVAFPQNALPELVLAFGTIPICGYATPGTEEGAAIIREPIRQADAVILDRHGSLTVGATAEDAFNKLDKLEHGARTLWSAQLLGGVRPLSEDQLVRIAAVRSRLGLAGPREELTARP